MAAVTGDKFSLDYENGWLDAYGRRSRAATQIVNDDYRKGYAAGARDRVRQDRKSSA